MIKILILELMMVLVVTALYFKEDGSAGNAILYYYGSEGDSKL